MRKEMDNLTSILIIINDKKYKLDLKPIDKIGESLKSERKRKGLSVFQINKQTGISNGTIHNIECGKGNPKLFNIVTYGNALGLETLPLLFSCDGLPFEEYFDTRFNTDAELAKTINLLSRTKRKALNDFLKILIN